MKSKLITIAKYLKPNYISKKHGGYETYKDDKISIKYDTYYPNVHVSVFIDGKEKTVAIYSGHGHTQELHKGAWCAYVEDLHAKALKAKGISLEKNIRKSKIE